MMGGRWPANVILSPGMAAQLDNQSGTLRTGGQRKASPRKSADVGAIGLAEQRPFATAGDAGGASRFFLTAGYEPWELEWIIANGLTPCGT